VRTTQIRLFCPGPDGHPSTTHPAEPIDAPEGSKIGIVGFTDDAALVDINDGASHVTQVVPFDGSPTADHAGWLGAVVR